MNNLLAGMCCLCLFVAITFFDSLFPNFNCRRLFDDLKRGMDFYLRSQGCGNATVLSVGEFNGMGDGFRRDRFAGEDVMHGHRRKASRIIITTLAGNLNGIARDVLPLLLENAGDVSRGTRAERDE